MTSRLQSLPRWVLCALLVLGLHVAVVAWSFFWRPEPKPLELPPEAMMVQLAPLPAAAPASVAAPPAAESPPPEPPAEPPAEPVVQPKPIEAPKPKLALPPPKPKPKPPKPKPKPVQQPKPKPQPPKPERKPDSKPPTESQAPTAPDSAAPREQASTTSQSGSPKSSNAVPNWQGLVRAHLSRYKRYPREARRRGDEGKVVVRFKIDGRGRLLSCEVVRSSGVRSLDRAALQMFRRADPLPPPPPELLKHGTLEVVAPFAYSLVEHQ